MERGEATPKATGELVERSTYQAYGGTESDYRPERWKSFREDYRFTGKEEDVEVGLIYFGYRFLNPLLNRWVSADPLTVHGLGADPNLYAYVSGRVLQSVDPLGLEATEAEANFAQRQAETAAYAEYQGELDSAKEGAKAGDQESEDRLKHLRANPVPPPRAQPVAQGPATNPVNLTVAAVKEKVKGKQGDEVVWFTNVAEQAAKAVPNGEAKTVHTGKELLGAMEDATATHGEIQNVVIFSHSSIYGVHMYSNKGFYASEAGYAGEGFDRENGGRTIGDLVEKMDPSNPAQAPSIAFAPNARIIFAGCNCAGAHTAGSDNAALAQAVADATRLEVLGANGSVEPAGPPGSMSRKAAFNWFLLRPLPQQPESQGQKINPLNYLSKPARK